MDEALSLSVVWACVDAVTKAIASSRWNVFRADGPGRRTQLPDEPLDYLLNTRPNPEMTAIAFREALLMGGALTWGNGYAEIAYDGRGKPAALYPLQTDRVVPRRDPETLELYYSYSQPTGGWVRLEPWQVFHVRGPGISGLMGDNVIARAAKAISLGIAAERFASTYFGNNTVIGGVLKHPKTLSEAAHNRLRSDWEERHRGPDASNKPALLEEGMEWVPFSNDAEKAQLVESRKFQIEEICRWYGVPPHKVQHLDRSTFNNIEHLGIEFVRDALTPWARRLEQEADYKLFRQDRGPWRTTTIDLAWLSFGDAKSRWEAHQIARRMGAYSVNDILVIEGKNTIGSEGDVRVVEANMVTLDAMARGATAPTRQERALPPAPAKGDDAEEDGAGEEMEPAPKQKGRDLARAAAVAVFASSLSRYARKLSNRQTDLGRTQDEAKVAARMAEERERSRPLLLEDCAHGIALLTALGATADVPAAVLGAADAIDGGATAEAAAESLVGALILDGA